MLYFGTIVVRSKSNDAVPALMLTLVAPTLALDNGVGLTPSMGWSSWNTFRCAISERLIREVVDPACEAAEAPTFYRPAEPHLSVAWALGDRTGGALTAEALQRSVEERLRAGGAEAGAAAADAGGSGETAAGGSAAVVVAVRGFESRSGNRVSTFPL